VNNATNDFQINAVLFLTVKKGYIRFISLWWSFW